MLRPDIFAKATPSFIIPPEVTKQCLETRPTSLVQSICPVLRCFICLFNMPSTRVVSPVGANFFLDVLSTYVVSECNTFCACAVAAGGGA